MRDAFAVQKFPRSVSAIEELRRMKVTQLAMSKSLEIQRDTGARARSDRNTGMPVVALRGRENLAPDHLLTADEGANVLEEIASDPSYRPSDRIKAIELMLTYGLGPRTEHEVRTTTSLDASPEEQEELLRGALRDPGVRQWLEETHPEALEELRIMVAEEAMEEADETDFELIDENSTAVPPRQGRYGNETGGVRVGTDNDGGETR
jgi:hypothetical protein